MILNGFAILISIALSPHSLAGVTEYTVQEEWEAAVNNVFTTLDFVLPDSTIIGEEYADLGVHFLDGNTHVSGNQGANPNDGFGAIGEEGPIHLIFDQPQAWIAVEFPGLIQSIELFSAGQLIYTSNSFFGFPTVDLFGGLISTQHFDEVFIHGNLTVFLDDLHFGVPGPGALPLLALGGVGGWRRRRAA
jgi:MYXO-CTERM domain-containing protein